METMVALQQYFNSISPLRREIWEKGKLLFTETSLKKGAYFIQEGESAKRIGFQNKGVVRAFYRNVDGDEYNNLFFVPQNLIGVRLLKCCQLRRIIDLIFYSWFFREERICY